MFLIHENGVVVVDAPPSYAALIPRAIAEVTDKPITHIIYSHSHADHIGGAGGFGGRPIIIAHEETRKLLARDNDPNRPLPTVTFGDTYTLKISGETLELSYHGNGHVSSESSRFTRICLPSFGAVSIGLHSSNRALLCACAARAHPAAGAPTEERDRSSLPRRLA
jgi:mRNA degradation ribonuclease J1/J2